jgi:hypothetical protein
MASRIITKKGSGAPLTSDLVHGELAVDTVNKRLYTENAGGTVIEVGTNPSTIDINAGTIDGTVIGGTTPAAVTTTALVATTADINAGTIDGTVIGGSTAAAGTFTTGQFNTSLNVDGTVTADGLTVAKGSNGTYATLSGDDAGGGRGLAFTSSSVSGSVGARHTLNALSSLGEIALQTNSKDRLNISSGGDISFYEDTGTTAKFFWDASAESLGIGTSSPAAQLHLQNGSSEDVSGSTIRMDLSGINPYWEVQARNGGNAANRQLGFYTSATSGDVLTLTQAGNVGIGTSSATQKLTLSNGTFQINGASTFVSNVEIGRVGGDNNMGFATGGTERMRIDSSGNLLVGTTSVFSGSGIVPKVTITNSAGLGVNGIGSADAGFATRPSADHSYYAGFFLNNAGTGVGNISCTASATAYNTSSDQRLKDNIVDAPSASDDIDAIQVRSFDWKVDGSHQKYGMVAQELMTVAPEAVSVPEDPEQMMGVDYSKLVPMLIKEVQSLRARVAQLEGAN